LRIGFSIISLTLVLTALIIPVSSVYAQTTSISNLAYPANTVTSGTATVSFDLTYSGLTSTDILAAFVYDKGTSTYADGTASSTPNPCISTATVAELNGKAVCAWILSSSSGVEHVTFNIAFSGSHIQTYDFTAVGGVDTTSGGIKVVYSSLSTQDFSVKAGSTWELTITMTFPVAVSVDGSTTATNPVELLPGTHSVSVPALVQLDNTSRLKFARWDDGSTQPNRTLNVQADTTIEATFVKQYLLNLTSPPVIAMGSGWYDEGSTAHFSVPATVPAPGVLGGFGAKLAFAGWYENGNRVSGSSDGQIAMLSAHSLTAQWTTDYTMPIIILVGVAAVAVGAFLAIILRGRGKSKR
jgi:hypothetical protein